jgi:Zn-dependent M28 family amino/carboxypeptidase
MSRLFAFRQFLMHTLIAAASLLLIGLVGLVFILIQPFTSSIPSTPPPVNPKILEAHVRMLSETFHPRDAAHPKNLNRTADYVRDQFVTLGFAPREQQYDADGLNARNIIVRIEPANSAHRAAPTLVIGAHYDSDAASSTPGADDNASGVAGLIELARALRASEITKTITRPIELVAYTLEEQPYFRSENMGSARHAAALRARAESVHLMLSLEMIGTFTDRPDSQTYPLPGLGALYPTRGNFIAIVGRFHETTITRRIKAAMQGATALPVRSINALPIVPGLDFSDHMNYWAEGFPALMITDTAFLRNKHYHERSDTAEKLDYMKMAQVVQGMWAVIHAEAVQPPAQ